MQKKLCNSLFTKLYRYATALNTMTVKNLTTITGTNFDDFTVGCVIKVSNAGRYNGKYKVTSINGIRLGVERIPSYRIKIIFCLAFVLLILFEEFIAT